MRADRLLNILLLLQNQGRLTAAELAARLEVSERTVQRDMEALGMAGVPVVAERGAGGGWRLAEGYRTNLTGLKAQEIASLLLAHNSRLLSDLGIRADFELARQKLLAASPSVIRRDAEAVRQRIHIDGAGWHQSPESLPYLAAVQEAVWAERKLRILYAREEATVEREVEPLGLVAKGSIWYLVAGIAGAIRTYRVSRLAGAVMLDLSFQRPDDFDLVAYWESSTARFKSNLPAYPARLKISEKVIARFIQERYVKILESQPAGNGWQEAMIEFDTLGSACEIILRFGPLVEALAPDELRGRLLAQARAIVDIYT